MIVQSCEFERARCPICGVHWDGACDPEDHERHDEREAERNGEGWAEFLGMSRDQFDPCRYPSNRTDADDWLEWLADQGMECS